MLFHQAVNDGALVYIPQAGNYMKPMLAKGGDFQVTNRRFCDYKYDGIRAQTIKTKMVLLSLIERVTILHQSLKMI